jgi:glutathione S-transferase
VKILLRASQRPEAVPLVLGLDGFETRFPGIATWMQRIEQVLAYEKTYPPHWRQT